VEVNAMTQTEVARQNGTDGAKSLAQRSSQADSFLRPAMDIFETDDGITVRADLPGVSKDRLNVRVDGNQLVLEGAIGIAPQEQMTAMYADVRAQTYRTNLVLSNELATDEIDAKLKDGVLTVRIPKRAEHRPRRIEVKA
jgi:HSP20 family molecular chaperone IbpA